MVNIYIYIYAVQRALVVLGQAGPDTLISVHTSLPCKTLSHAKTTQQVSGQWETYVHAYIYVGDTWWDLFSVECFFDICCSRLLTLMQATSSHQSGGGASREGAAEGH